MPTFHYAQLPDGRWIKLRELSSAQQATAYEACATKAPNGALLPPNPITLDHECFKLALVAVSVRKPLFKLVDGKPVQRRDADGKPLFRLDGKTPAYERFERTDLVEADWKPLGYAQLETDYDSLFGPKDRAVISTLYARAHTPQEEDRDFFETMSSVAETG